MIKKVIFAILILTLLSACEFVETEPRTDIEPNTIIIDNFKFQPDELTVDAGTAITWKNEDFVTHTVVSYNVFESPNLKKGEDFSFTFDETGEYEYYCSIHPSMRGKVIVI